MEDKKILHLVNEAIVYKIKNHWSRNTGRGFTKEEIQQFTTEEIFPDHANIFLLQIREDVEYRLETIILKNQHKFGINLLETETIRDYLIEKILWEDSEEE